MCHWNHILSAADTIYFHFAPDRICFQSVETIHRNWSSDRWRENIEERMKLLVLHYRNLEDKLQRMEDERRESSTRTLAFIAVLLTTFTLASVIADLTNLLDTSQGNYLLKRIGFYIGVSILLLVVPFLLWFFWPKPKLRSRGNNNKQPEPDLSDETTT
jgi:hypothetical protein